MMRIIDENGNEVSDVDESKGQLTNATVIRQDAAPIDNETKWAWDDDDYEEVLVWHEYTEEELSERDSVTLDDVTDALADISDTVSANADDLSTISDAIAELSELVANLAGSEVDNG